MREPRSEFMFYINDFLEYLRLERNYSEQTVINYRYDLELFERYFKQLDESMEWNMVDKDVIRNWIMDMMDHGNTPSSVNRRLSSLRSFFRFLLMKKQIATDPSRSVQGPKKTSPLPCFLREEEMDRLLDDSPFPETFDGLRDRTVLLLFYSTGIRLAELVGLDIKDIDLPGRQLKVTGKRNKQRIIPFGEELANVLQNYLKARSIQSPQSGDDALFLSDNGLRITPQKVRAQVKFYLSKVTTLKKRSPHVLRHTFATVLLNHDADLEVVKELLGHQSLDATQIYTHTTFEELKKVYKLAHPRA